MATLIIASTLWSVHPARATVHAINDFDAAPVKAILRPELGAICACESSYEGTASGKPQQFEKDGVTVRTGRINVLDKGMCQINLKYHQAQALKMKLDLLTEYGNITYANWLYGQQGSKPWNWSAGCWLKK
mgnify:FL=1